MNIKPPNYYVKHCLKNWFNYPEDRLYCQVSSTNNDMPHTRTMDLYHFTDDGNIILLTATNTRKWSDLSVCPNISICIVNLNHGQIIAEGQALLKTASNAFEVTSLYWNNYLDQYWRDFYLKRSKESKNVIPDLFGVILIKPNFWDILELNTDDYLKSSRKQYKYLEGQWQMSSIAPD